MKQGVFKYIFILAFIVLLIITYIVFYNNEDETNVVQDQTSTVSTLLTDLRLGIAGFDSLNPIVSNNKNIKEISRLIFDSLISINSNYSLEYGLATEIAKQDNLTYIIKLRENVTWHDGTEFTAQDVKFTIDTIKNSFGGSVYGENLQYVTGLEIVDNYTIKISLSQEVEFFEYNLTFPILSNNYFANEDFVNTAKNNTIIGTGLYKVAEKTDNSIRLEKNENYWNEEKDSLITEINISLYNNIGEVYTAFKSGYIDIMDININNVSEYVGSLGYNTVNYDDRNVDFLAFNTQSPNVSEPAVRKAISLLLDKNNIVANLGSGYTTTNFLFSSNNWMYDSRLDVSYNSEEALNLLTGAGWTYTNNTWVKDGRTLSFTIVVESNNSIRTTAARLIAEQLANSGIQVYVNEVSSSSYNNYLNNKNYDAILAGITIGYSPKISTLYYGDNLANYNNDSVNEVLGNVNNINDYNELRERYLEVYDQIMTDMPYIYLYRETDSVIYNQTLCGTISPNAYSIFYNIDKWYRQ